MALASQATTRRPTRLTTLYAVYLAVALLFTLVDELFLRRWLFRYAHHAGAAAYLAGITAGSLPNFLAARLSPRRPLSSLTPSSAHPKAAALSCVVSLLSSPVSAPTKLH
jgi:hypothetical protein